MGMKLHYPVFTGVIIICACLYFAGSEILTGLSESLIRKNLPDYMRIGRVKVDNHKGEFIIADIRVMNPEAYEDPYILTAEKLTASYKANILNTRGPFEVTRIEISGITINIERLPGGGINIVDMRTVMKGETSLPVFEELEPVHRRELWSGSGSSGNNTDKALAVLRKIKDYTFSVLSRKAAKARKLVKLTENILISDGKLKFKDRAISSKPLKIELDHISGDIGIGLNEDMTRIEKLSSKASGSIKGIPGQYLKWDISADLSAPRPTMDNKLILSGVDLELIKPYYDRFFPIDVKHGFISGSFIYNLDNGEIGSNNILTVKDLVFENKPDNSSLLFWSEDIGALVEYLRTAEGQTLFDFKIKGDMDNPKFYPGPEVKKAIGRLTIDRIRDFVDRALHRGGAAK
ncbi:MAG: DUF748 domain-containing protein [Candidatus Omnitrophica bacterium]|nr:DUF748 domain-containing protein [Candidatus Omnitrophota bacterium]